ncbi:hypothetical protein H6F90_29875 [Trichocoleus sp. FACHB-591]|uniref:hypothetical protein n=1 Tax=Trichocoleus sp. FACHB-591 TaxID=2692872 RepID=UPI0016899195|nr:hypothetical protein [Trichocoleus sp. FACHB-591]MBD2099276.1 hypothetical protein [Trichocoleus sp. FACHB-591]
MLISLHAEGFKHSPQLKGENAAVSSSPLLPFSQHPDWELGMTWKSALNNLRLLLQPYCCWGWLESWLQVFPIPELRQGFEQLMDWMDTFRLLPSSELEVAELKVA